MNDIINLVKKNSFTDAERVFNFLIEMVKDRVFKSEE